MQPQGKSTRLHWRGAGLIRFLPWTCKLHKVRALASIGGITRKKNHHNYFGVHPGHSSFTYSKACSLSHSLIALPSCLRRPNPSQKESQKFLQKPLGGKSIYTRRRLMMMKSTLSYHHTLLLQTGEGTTTLPER